MSLVSTASLSWQSYVRAEQFLPWNLEKGISRAVVQPNWIAGPEKTPTNRFWYCVKTPQGKEFVMVDPDEKTQEPAFDHVRLAAALSKARRKPCEPTNLPFSKIEYAENGRTIQFDVADTHWMCDLVTHQCSDQGESETPAPDELSSPDGHWAAFAKQDNLFLRSINSNEPVQLCDDGEPYFNYGTSPDSRTTVIYDRLNARKLPLIAVWSPDSTKLVTHKLDQRQVLEMHLVQSVPQDGRLRPQLHSYRYPMPGDEHIPQTQLVVFDIKERTQTLVDFDPEPCLYISGMELQQVWWSEDSSRVYFVHRERGDKALRLCVADAETGATRVIVEEHTETHIEPTLLLEHEPNVRLLGDGSEVIWYSQRDGWAHLYLYDGISGELKNQITSGPWVVRNILHVDEAKRKVYFLAGGRETGRNPYYRHLYRINLDGTELELLTPEDADHHATTSPTGEFLVDVFSRVDLPPTSVVRSSDGELITTLEEADIEHLLELGWQPPEPFCVKARDGITDIYGVIYRPSNFDPEKTYPVLDSIYGGPQITRSPKMFIPDVQGQAEAFAELGFIVVTIDGMGTPLRSKAFHDVSYGKMEEAGGLEDHIAGLRQLAARYPQLDLERVGIYGQSGGGFASTHAILAYPDFFKVAVSGCGNHDQRAYLAGWGEKFHGFPEGDNYVAQANSTLATNLKGKLLLAHGDMDENTYLGLALKVVDALIKANKDFDLLVLPNRHHSISRDPYYMRRRWDYFVRHLTGMEPPHGYQISEPDAAVLASLGNRYMLMR